MHRAVIAFLVAMLLASAALPDPVLARSRRSRAGAAWLSFAHPGLGEWKNAGWGLFFERCPQRKFWLGFIPLYGWPGYLQVISIIDAYHGRTSDNLTPID